MYYRIESRWPSWSKWKPILNACYERREEAYNRLKTLKRWNKGDFRVVPIVENDPSVRIIEPIL